MRPLILREGCRTRFLRCEGDGDKQSFEFRQEGRRMNA